MLLLNFPFQLWSSADSEQLQIPKGLDHKGSYLVHVHTHALVT